MAGAVEEPGELPFQPLPDAGVDKLTEIAAAHVHGGIVELPEEFPVRLLDGERRVETDDTCPWLVELAQ
ncbi:hypothetical protein GCM10009548_57820 [Streptomyces malaysiensis subsp. malaysiensis]